MIEINYNNMICGSKNEFTVKVQGTVALFDEFLHRHCMEFVDI